MGEACSHGKSTRAIVLPPPSLLVSPALSPWAWHKGWRGGRHVGCVPLADLIVSVSSHERWRFNMQPRSVLKHSTCRLTRCRGSSHDVRCRVAEQGQMERMTTSCVDWHSSSCGVVMTVRNRDVLLQSPAKELILALQKFEKLCHSYGRFSR